MQWFSILGTLILIMSLSGCLFFPHNFRIAETSTEKRKAVIWAKEDNSIMISGSERINRYPYYQGKAGFISLKIQIRNPTKTLRFLSEEVKIYYWDETRDNKVFLQLKENSISNDKLASSRRTTFDVTGIISEEIFRSEIPIDTFYVRFPDIVYEQDTVSIGPIGFYVYHWLDFLFQGQKNKD